MQLLRRISTDVKELNLDSPGGNRCPEVWELDSGDFAVIGSDITEKAKNMLPKESILSDDERIVLVPKEVLRSAKPNIA